MKNLTLINGNGKQYSVGLPKLLILGKFNDTARQHILENTGLVFKDTWNGMEAQPIKAEQIVKLFLTYDFKTQSYDNCDYKNTIMLKSCNEAGFKVDAICYNCCKKNWINTNGLNPDSMLGC